MFDWANEATDIPTNSAGSATPGWLNTVLNTGLGVAGLFTNKTPAAAKTGTSGATNWTMIGIIGGGVLLVVVLIMALRRGG